MNSKRELPTILVDKDNDFAAIKLKEGVEAKSYLKDGVLFPEDEDGNVIEVQILNLSKLSSLDDLVAS